tara:strand:+ start:450 stop:1265 length:816 start_codon:yes stop_codon:yes gene_type:complete
MTKIAVLQMTSGIDPETNAAFLADMIRNAAGEGSAMLFTPEMSGMLNRDRKRAAAAIRREDEDSVLATVRDRSAKHGIWTCIGSLAIDTGEGIWVNRSFVVDANGEIAARYDKIHMFDVDLASGETWRESSAYRPGNQVVTAQTPVGRLGLAICYDLRFPALFEALGNARCDLISVPAAFTVPTGRAHWHVLQRARAIEASAYLVAAAQAGTHADGRTTYGHSLVIDPWGEVLVDMGEGQPGLAFAEVNPARVSEVRAQVPSLANRRELAK